MFAPVRGGVRRVGWIGARNPGNRSGFSGLCARGMIFENRGRARWNAYCFHEFTRKRMYRCDETGASGGGAKSVSQGDGRKSRTNGRSPG
ncbi:hypothetical protein Sfum_1358 [Syntrophobacter fumaroxidans MPOB]|uniref:Uncharacterized protein n=1 Tax=Syntrophobacter fumaroxidans (strain DSM 10017 / MPOB) TaxID=335543 RepID=A0LHZ7_SYNFM|nr:hypothetical protein Sfum_1358 [Syntrophobacter fumaroxidans MPOB]